MTTTSFFLAFVLGAWGFVRIVRKVGARHFGVAVACLLVPPLVLPVARYYGLNFSREYRILALALGCLLPTIFYFGVLATP